MSKEPKYRLTEQGEAQAIEVIGGQDIQNTAIACLLVLEKECGKEMANEFPAMLGAQSAMKVVRAYLSPEVWQGFVRWAEDGLEKARPEYFEKMPHAC